jgi:hypothetical protein
MGQSAGPSSGVTLVPTQPRLADGVELIVVPLAQVTGSQCVSVHLLKTYDQLRGILVNQLSSLGSIT